MITVRMEVEARSKEDLISFLRFCAIVGGAGCKGEGRQIKVFVDGDGSGSYRFRYQTQEGWHEVEPLLDYDKEETIWLGE